jgi:hypothetical protein
MCGPAQYYARSVQILSMTEIVMTEKKKSPQQQLPRSPLTMSGLLAVCLLTAGLSGGAASQTLPGKPYSMFGDPMCSEWPGMNAEARFAWTSGFLSILSMGHETSRRTGQQKYKDLKGIDEVVEVINKHCAANPAAQASEAAAPYLNQ